MKESFLQSRSLHYLVLTGLLLALTVGGVVTLSCSTPVIPAGSLNPPQQTGVKQSDESGIVFDIADTNATTATYDLSPTVAIDPPFEEPVDVPCTWKAVASLDNFGNATSLDDFPPADPTDVVLTGNNTVVIHKNESRVRTAKFVCMFTFNEQNYLRKHVVRVGNF